MILIDKTGEKRPMVDLKGRFYTLDQLDEQFVNDYVQTDLYGIYQGRYVKNAYDESLDDKEGSLDN